MFPMLRLYPLICALVMIEHSDCSVAQHCADLSVVLRVLSPRVLMRYFQRFAGLTLCRCEEHPHLVVKAHHCGRENVLQDMSHFRFQGGFTILFRLQLLPRNLFLLENPLFWSVGLPFFCDGQLFVRNSEFWELRCSYSVEKLS